MIRKLLTIIVISAVGLFVYYFAISQSTGSNQQKAEDAGRQVVGAFKDAGVEGLVKTAILKAFGYENSRYLHTTNDDGRLVVYGMAPPAVDLNRLQAEVRGVTGVKDVELAVTALTPQLAARRGVQSAP